MYVGFRPNEKVQPYLETLTARGEKTRFLNEAVEFTLNYKSAFERQGQMLEMLLNQYQDLIDKLDGYNGRIDAVNEGIEVLSKKLDGLNQRVAALKETGIKAEQSKNRTEEQRRDGFSENVGFLGMSLGDISL
ncbi:hypothetical protein [Novibacillus thermophilus]|uniref:Uncharacterized protein n=1 Tax=Novibacillus thermophilus TaxID=1471761 RepID=A0A1U9K6L4_9BACL|nr:hypothetical protein [Novibacillus thermophilus]AQS55674.1 hypothetical protein B0W44_07615 [Novibacillus thermophilus]